MPTHQDSTDKSIKERAIFHKDDAGQILLKTEAQEQCRNVYTLNDIYVLPETRFPRGAPWIFGGAATASTGFTLQARDKAQVGYSAIGLGAALMGYGIYINRLVNNTRISHRHDVKGEYDACGEWLPLPTQNIGIQLRAPSGSDVENVSILIETDSNGVYEVPGSLSGALRLQSQDTTSVIMQNGSISKAEVPPVVIGDNDWICDVLNGFDSMSLPDSSPDSWELHFRIADTIFAVPWLQSDGQDFFSHHKQAIQNCDSSTRRRFARLATKSAANSSEASSISKIIKTVTRSSVRRPSSTARASTGESATSKTAAVTPFDPNTTIVLGRAHKVAGSYRCTSGSRKANLSIRQDGNFVLMVELDTGTAYGICSDQACGIQGISGTAMAFTKGLKKFGIRGDGDGLILNEEVRCQPRRRRK